MVDIKNERMKAAVQDSFGRLNISIDPKAITITPEDLLSVTVIYELLHISETAIAHGLPMARLLDIFAEVMTINQAIEEVATGVKRS